MTPYIYDAMSGCRINNGHFLFEYKFRRKINHERRATYIIFFKVPKLPEYSNT